MKSVLVTIPVRNEARFLEGSIRHVMQELATTGWNCRLSVAEDGSTDGTPQVIEQLQREFPNLLVRTSRERLGRGCALRQIWAEADADIYAFADADLAAGPPALVNVIAQVANGADVATGSRYSPGAVVRRPPLRREVSLAYNRLVRMVFGGTILDHQCGLKAFSRDAKNQLFAMTRENSWAWDTEVLVLAERAGMRVVEVPVEWTEYRGRRTPIRRLLSDVYLHGSALLRLKSDLTQRVARHRFRPATGFPTHTVDLVGPKDAGSGHLR
jgi:glycosyltransferase AglD